MPTVLAAMAPNFSWTEPEEHPYGGTNVGPDVVLKNVFMKLGTEWDGFFVVPQEFISEGDTVIALCEQGGTYKATGKSYKTPSVHVWKFGAGRLHSFRAHMDTVLIQRALR